VRAKVAALRARQCESQTPEAREAGADLVAHIRLAHGYLQESKRTPLVITHGLSGSGKSWLAAQLLQVLGAVCVRSDVERRRLETTGNVRADERYTAAAIDQTYRTLIHRARTIVDCGFAAIIDATFLKRRHRLLFLELARELGVPFVILDVHAPQEVLQARIAKRQADGTDPSEATISVLLRQREEMDALNSEERKLAMNVGNDSGAEITLIAERILRGRPAPWSRRLEESIDDQC
jgi:predicted kinase